MQDVSVAPTLKKEGEIAPDSAMASVKSPLGEHCHLPAVRISDGVIGVQPTAEWTQPPPGLIDSQKKDDDPIESFSGTTFPTTNSKFLTATCRLHLIYLRIAVSSP